MSTFGGAELGCIAALKTLEICSRPETRRWYTTSRTSSARGAARIQDENPAGSPASGRTASSWPRVRPSAGRDVRDARTCTSTASGRSSRTLDPRVLQFKPGLLLRPPCEGSLDRGGRHRQRLGRVRGRTGSGSRRRARRTPELRRSRAQRPRYRAAGDVGAPGGRRSFRTRQGATDPRILEAVGPRWPRRRARSTPSGRSPRPASGSSSTRSQEQAVLARDARRLRRRRLVTPRIDHVKRIVEVPRPAGVVLALTPTRTRCRRSTSRCCSSPIIRNAVVVSPHPIAKRVCADASRVLGAAAVEAGAPAGSCRSWSEPMIP